METISIGDDPSKIKHDDISHKHSNVNSFNEMLKISFECFQELKLILCDKKILSKDDIIVLNDIIIEVNSLSIEMISTGSILEARNLNQICIKIINLLLKILNSNVAEDHNKNKIDYLFYPFSLKLAALEIKFHLLFMIEKNYIESEKLLLEIINIQNAMKMSSFNRGSSRFYLAILKFCKKLY